MQLTAPAEWVHPPTASSQPTDEPLKCLATMGANTSSECDTKLPPDAPGVHGDASKDELCTMPRTESIGDPLGVGNRGDIGDVGHMKDVGHVEGCTLEGCMGPEEDVHMLPEQARRSCFLLYQYARLCKLLDLFDHLLATRTT